MMSAYTQFAKGLSTWYRGGVRGFLSEVAHDRVEQLDQEFARLGALGELIQRPMPVCFLGAAGVGKSTLINALVAGRDVILPAGGVGPLTAEATRVCHARERQFRVAYHPPGKLNNLLFVLECA
jgi:predicted GTPase